ncbi:penicillin-binding transpeptidase domain-containing protein [Aquihabitans sp. McL0605]|uniref:peptidoglycan D,D-transpeptidase FtsI family protein n=1 Tax=Aquihabitans sp. McL0605 TaxID=3415671 RepID=UPI003CF7E282
MSDDDFFGRPSSTTIHDQRPATRPAPARPAPRRAPKKPAATTARAPRSASLRTPPSAPRASRPPSAPPSRSTSASGPRRIATAPAPRPVRPARPTVPGLTGAQLRTRTRRRLLAFVIAMVAVVAAVGVQLVKVQVVHPARYVAYGQSQRDGSRALPASRGAIYDRNGQAFAMSVAEPMVVADPAQVKHPVATANALARILGADAAGIQAELTTTSRYKVIAKQITQAQVTKIKAAQAKSDLEGITLEDEYLRSNPNGDLANAVVGHALPEGQKTAEGQTGGISGIEREYDRQLKGQPGKLYYEQDVWGKPIAGGHRKLDPAKQGTDLYLTLDQSLQYEAEHAISDEVAASGAKSGQAVIMRPSTGEVLAMASVAKDDQGKIANTRDNRSVTSVFEPGSVNKMITVAGAIQDGAVTPTTMFDVPDQLQVADRVFHDSELHPASAWSTTDILVTSSNIGTIKIAQQLGKARIDHYLRDFGFGQDIGLGFPGETRGILKDPQDWSGSDIGAMPIGQGIAVSALQMLAAYNVVANDGVYVAPKLVASTDSGAGQVPTEPSSGHRVISADTAAKMQAMLSKVVSDGTGKDAAVPGYEAAGKTGTARIPQNIPGAEDGYLDANGRYEYQSSFVGMINGADLSIIVTVEDPRTSIYGADIAAPVFAHLAATALRRYEVPPPALLDPADHAVPELSASAREVDGEDVASSTSTPQG